MNSPELRLISTLPAFDRLVQPMSSTFYNATKEDISKSKEDQVIKVWRGNHLGDKERYEMCLELNLPFVIKNIHLVSENKAAIFICSDQLVRKDLTEEYRKYLIGQKFLYTQKENKRNNITDSKYAIAHKIAKDLSISTGTVLKYSVYATAVNEIFILADALAKDILLGKLKVSHENMIELSRLKPEEAKSVHHSAIKENVDHLTFAYIRHEVKWSHMNTKAPVSRTEKAEYKMREIPAIRQMPKYDPDNDVNSLCMTMDSWISSIERISKSTNFRDITSKAGLRLIRKLTILEHSAKVMQEKLEERSDI